MRNLILCSVVLALLSTSIVHAAVRPESAQEVDQRRARTLIRSAGTVGTEAKSRRRIKKMIRELKVGGSREIPRSARFRKMTEKALQKGLTILKSGECLLDEKSDRLQSGCLYEVVLREFELEAGQE